MKPQFLVQAPHVSLPLRAPQNSSK